jgi:hypothetical protein
MLEMSRRVTIFTGTYKRLARWFSVEMRSNAARSTSYHRLRYIPRRARQPWTYDDDGSQLVIVDGWDHPEFDELPPASGEASLDGRSDPPRMILIGAIELPRSNPAKLVELRDYLRTLDRSLILFDTRPPQGR